MLAGTLFDQRAITAENTFRRSGINAQGVARNSASSSSCFIVEFLHVVGIGRISDMVAGIAFLDHVERP